MATNNNNNININMNNNNQQNNINGNNMNNNQNVSAQQKIQLLAQQKIQNGLTPSLQEYKNYQMQQQQRQQQQQQQMQQQQPQQGDNNNNNNNNNNDDEREPSDLDNTNLYIKGLWKDCTQVELDDLFKQFGVISQSRVYGDGVGFVRFEQGYEAKAVKLLLSHFLFLANLRGYYIYYLYTFFLFVVFTFYRRLRRWIKQN